MPSEQVNISLRYHLLFSLTWIFSLLFYPIWIEPATTEIRSLIYTIVAAWTLINIILLYRFLVNYRIQSFSQNRLIHKTDMYSVILACILLLFILMHIYPISFPLMISDDEAAHASGGIGLITRFLSMKDIDTVKFLNLARIGLWTSLFIISVLLSIGKTRDAVRRRFLAAGPRHYLSFYAFLFFISAILFFLTKNMQFHLMLMRYPPLGKILYAFSISLFGINEFAVRIPQLLFAVFTSVLIFRICEYSLNSKETGLISACCYAFSPMVFYYSSLGEIICGAVFFIVIVIYFYLRHIQTNHNGYLLISFYLISLGFLYYQVIVLMPAVIIAGVLFLKENRIKLPLLVKLCYFSLVPIIPYLVIGKIYPNNPFGLDLSNWLKPGPAFGYAAVLPKQLSYPLTALVLVSMFFIISKKEFLKPAVFVFFISFILYYIFYTSTSINAQLYPLLYTSHESGGVLVGNERYPMFFYPFFSIITGLFVTGIAKSIKWKHSFNLFFAVLFTYLILICTIWHVPPLNAQFVTYKNLESRYFPVDNAMQWVNNNVMGGERILILRVASATFYRDKYVIERDKIVDFWYDLEEVSTPHKLKLFCMENKISYIMFSYGIAEDMEIMEYLKGNRGNEFTEAAKFNLGGNYIYIYETKI